MKTIKKWALALCLVSLFTSYSNSQTLTPGTESYTENLTNFTSESTPTTSTWQNAGTIGEPLTCWAPGDPGYCGPLPMIAAWGEGSNVINFSYQLTDLYQVVNIGAALANAGTGVKVTGFNFSFTAKNGNGWDNGQQDYLSAYVKFYSNSQGQGQGQGQGQNNVAESYLYDLNYQFGWTQFNYNETFKNPYDISKLSTARYGFIGGDSNGWAGPYGPEVSNTSFSLKYSVDPCASDVFYSPSCPGYMDALKKLMPASTTESVIITPTATGITVTSIEMTGITSSTSTTSEPMQTTSAPLATSSQLKAGEVVVSGSKPSVSTIMNILRNEQKRIGSVEQSATTSAIDSAALASEQAQDQAESVAGSLTSDSISSSASQFIQSGLGFRMPGQSNNTSDMSSGGNPQSTSTSNNSSISTMRNFISIEVEIPQSGDIKLGVSSVLSDYMNEKFTPLQELESTQDSAVKRNVQPNEAAGGIDVAAIATQPKGYEVYTQLTMIDASFYKVDSIYKNQKTIDNEKVLRGLQGGSDRLHRELVDQQYKGK
jgi:hypothetical protein